MWWLIATVCLEASAADVTCQRQVVSSAANGMACWSLVKPLKEHLEAAASDRPVIYMDVTCDRGRGA